MRPVLLALLLSGSAAGAYTAPVAAQERGAFDPVLERIAQLWADGDAVAIAGQTAERGLELEIEGEPIGPIATRQAAAALRRLFSGQVTVSIRTTMAARVEGAEDRAYGELAWEHRPDGAALSEKNTVFVGLVREGPGWRVSQIRILP